MRPSRAEWENRGLSEPSQPLRRQPVLDWARRGRDGTTLEVRGLDAFSGSPVLDVKPYTKDRLVPDLRESGWHEELIRKTGARRV